MARMATFPTTVEDLRTLEIAFLNKHGYLKIQGQKTGTVTWTNPNSGTKNSISIAVNLNDDERGTMRLWYTANETEKMDYCVHLVSQPSNLGKGRVWYFVCPKTGNLCRKLYYRPYLFVSRFAFNLMYRKQIESKKMREWQKLYGAMFEDEKEMQFNKIGRAHV